MKNVNRLFLVTAAALLIIQSSYGQASKEKNQFMYSNKISVLAGLIQPMVLKGGNLEVTYFTRKMSFDYSHGFSLDMAGKTITGDAKMQSLAYHLPYSTGFGVGFRFTSSFDIRVEPKMHSWQVYYDGETQERINLIKAYKTYTVGLGAYYRYMPFQKKENWLKGITTSSSFRWWPNVGSSITGHKFTYYNKLTKTEESLNAANIGIAGSPFLINISIGYTFGGR